MSDDSVRDLVKRLRYHVCTGSEPPDCGDDACEAIHEAADIIETQAARIIRLQSDLDRAEGFREGVRSGEAVEGWATNDPTPGLVLFYSGEDGADRAPVTSTRATLILHPEEGQNPSTHKDSGSTELRDSEPGIRAPLLTEITTVNKNAPNDHSEEGQ